MAAADIKYVLVERFESAECFWKVLILWACGSTFKIYIFDVITNVFEALRGSPALYHENNIHEYVRYCAFKKINK